MVKDLRGLAERIAKPKIDFRKMLLVLALAFVGFGSSGPRPQLRQLHAINSAIGDPGVDTVKPVTFLSAAELRRAIENAPEEKPGRSGLYSLYLSENSDYPIVGIRRTAATNSEVHGRFSDVWYVLDGSGILVTGGSVAGSVETSAGEIRGRAISGGKARRVRRGDFGFIPAGVPHWISKIEGSALLYIVVKVPLKDSEPPPRLDQVRPAT